MRCVELLRAEFNRREATSVSKSNMLDGFSKHMWLFEEDAGQIFCNYRLSPPPPRAGDHPGSAKPPGLLGCCYDHD